MCAEQIVKRCSDKAFNRQGITNGFVNFSQISFYFMGFDGILGKNAARDFFAFRRFVNFAADLFFGGCGFVEV